MERLLSRRIEFECVLGCGLRGCVMSDEIICCYSQSMSMKSIG